MYQQPKDTTMYIGIATNKETATESDDPKDYVWSKFKGDDGLPGVPGADGKTSYFHIKYSSVQNPTSASQMTETPSDYIGTYVDYTQADSTDPKKYTWARFKGFNGEDGLPGVNGEDGKTSYLHIKYSDNGGLSFTANNGEDPGAYIGQYVDFVQKDSDNPTDYTWSLIRVKAVRLEAMRQQENTMSIGMPKTDRLLHLRLLMQMPKTRLGGVQLCRPLGIWNTCGVQWLRSPGYRIKGV